MVGQRFIQLLDDHPFFDLSLLFSSERKSGNQFREMVDWQLEGTCPDRISRMMLNDFDPELLKEHDIDVVFSALPGSLLRDMEKEAALDGGKVFSNSASHRYDRDVPIMIPEVNGEHLGLISSQDTFPAGFIVTNPNCSTSGLVMSLAPISQFGIKKVYISTYQALSGAGYPGPSSLSMLGNIVPFIRKEEEKISIESGKILGKISGNKVEEASIKIIPSCARVPVKDGHLLSINVELEKEITPQEAKDTFSSLRSLPGLPSAPAHPIVVLDEEDRPQPLKDVSTGSSVKGMSVSIGRIRTDGNVLSYFALVNNTIRGGAGNAILTAEMAHEMNFIGGGRG
jgi:aspartate-semialdehyde dehydrogenase